MKKYANKRRHTAVKKTKVGETVLCRQEHKNSLTPHQDLVPMVVIGVKGSIITTRNSQKIRTRNYADWKLLKNGYRASVRYGESDGESEGGPDPVPPQEVTNDPGAGESTGGREENRLLISLDRRVDRDREVLTCCL